MKSLAFMQDHLKEYVLLKAGKKIKTAAKFDFSDKQILEIFAPVVELGHEPITGRVNTE